MLQSLRRAGAGVEAALTAAVGPAEALNGSWHACAALPYLLLESVMHNESIMARENRPRIHETQPVHEPCTGEEIAGLRAPFVRHQGAGATLP